MQIQGAVKPSDGEPRRKMILLHGLGSNEEDMYGLACELDPTLEVICLRAPYEYGPGFAWFNIEWSEESGISIDAEQYWQSVEILAEILPQIGSNLIVGGFSQGAMLTAGLLARHPELVGDAVLLSGRSPGEGPGAFAGRVFQAHGIMDDVIPLRDGEDLRRSMTPLGDRLEFHAYPMGHTVCAEEIEDLNAWLAI